MPFDRLIHDARAFLTDLDANNTRDWFHDNKDRYERDLKVPAQALQEEVTTDLQRLTGLPVSAKLFRPQRDIRFSKDKTPYKTHLHMLWSVGSGLGETAYYFGIELDRVILGGGCMKLEKDKLEAYRARASGPKGADLAREMAAARTAGIQFSEPELKRVPAPFEPDHLRADLLRRKSLTFWKPLPGDTADLRKALKNGFATLLPLQNWLLSLK